MVRTRGALGVAGAGPAAVVVWLSILLVAAPAAGHFATVSFIELTVGPGELAGRLLLDPYHLDTVLPLDADADGTITAGEVDGARERIRDLADQALVARVAGQPLAVEVGHPQLVLAEDMVDQQVDIRPDFPLIAVPLRYAVDGRPARTTLAYDLFLDPGGDAGTGTHQAFAAITIDGRLLRHAFDAQTPTLALEPAAGGRAVMPLLAATAALGAGLVPVARWWSRRDDRASPEDT